MTADSIFSGHAPNSCRTVFYINNYKMDMYAFRNSRTIVDTLMYSIFKATQTGAHTVRTYIELFE